MFPWTQAKTNGYQPIDTRNLNSAKPILTPTKANLAFDDYENLAGPFLLSRGRPSADFDDVYIRLDKPMAVRDIKFNFYGSVGGVGGVKGVNSSGVGGLVELKANFAVKMHRFPYRLKKVVSETRTENGYWLGGGNGSDSGNSGDKGVFITAEQLTSLNLVSDSVRAAVKCSVSGVGDSEYYFSEVLGLDEVVSELVILISSKSGSYSWVEGGYRDGDVLYIGGPIRLGN